MSQGPWFTLEDRRRADELAGRLCDTCGNRRHVWICEKCQALICNDCVSPAPAKTLPFPVLCYRCDGVVAAVDAAKRHAEVPHE